MEALPSDKAAPPFGRYVIRERMAEGGMGEVFLAVAVGADGFEKPVVIKRLLPKFAGRADVVSLLAAEAKLMTRLVHPNIVQVIDFGRGDNDDYFVVMELVSGTNLGKFCQSYTTRGERVPLPLALYISTQVLRGLAYAHANASADGKRLVHRDISPGNILLSTFGEVKVADFGVALVAGSAETGNDDGWIVGKPAYMAPEQLDRTSSVDERADIYSVGAVLFQSITGVLHRGDISPSDATIPVEISDEARSILAEIAPRELADVVLRALAPNPDARFDDARQMARAIEQLVETGQRIATADELSEAVSEFTQQQPSSTKAVMMLSAAESFASGTELTRVSSEEDKHGFTLKIHDPPPGGTITATPTNTPRQSDFDFDVRAMRPRRRWMGFAALGMVLGGITVALLAQRPRTGTGFGASPTMATAELRTAVAPTQVEPSQVAPSTAETSPLSAVVDRSGERASPGTSSSPSSFSARKEGGHGRKETSKEPTKDPPTKETVKDPPPKEPSPATTATANCRGQLHVYAGHGWLVSGGPGSVQAPGRYDWPCGTYALKAVSRLDPNDVRSVAVTIREGAPGVVDLR